jgi:glyoxylase-like metal-dependent hydrolase (beta-lactamase superfamily II)
MVASEPANGIHRIEAPLGERYVALYVIRGDDCSLLVDTGVDDSIRAHLVPALSALGVDPGHIRYVVNTHSDFDHVGGNAAVKRCLRTRCSCAVRLTDQ